MTNQQSSMRPNLALRLDWLVSNLRWLWLLLAALFVSTEIYFGLVTGVDMNRLFILLGAVVVLNTLYAAMLWAGFFPSGVAIFALVLDTGFAIALLIMLREHAQLLLPIMAFPVIIAGVRWNIETGVAVAIPLITVYGSSLLSLLQADQPTGQAELISEAITFAVNALTLLLAGTLPGIFIGQHVIIAREFDASELERLRVENARGRLISEMAQTLSSTLDYREVLYATINTAYSALSEVAGDDESTVGVVLLFEGDDGRLTVASGRNISRTTEGRKVSAEEGLIGATISSADATITYSANKDKVLTSFAPRCRSAICVPLRAGYNTYGVILFCSTRARLYNSEHKSLLTTFCSQAIIAMQNAQLFEDVQFEQQKILEKEAEARRKLARDLHDGPTQSVAAIAMRINFIKLVVQNNDMERAYQELVNVEEIAQNTTKEIRTMLFAMRPVILETQGLLAALHQYADRLNDTEDFRVMIFERNYEGQLDKEAEGVIFAIIEEAVGNAKKHAEATEIRISVMGRENALAVEIKDDGVGFDVQQTTATYDQRTSLGLINMNERAQLVGGHCTLHSARGKGTSVKVEVPYEHKKESA